MPREWYLVRFGNTRKGSGTFYTRPHLAGPIVQRTLEPLCYDENAAPRLPEQILALKVCDPAMGSGSFLVLALRYFTEALRESLYTHKRLGTRADGGFARLADGEAGNGLREDPLPVPPSHEQFDERSPLSSEAPCSRKMLVWS